MEWLKLIPLVGQIFDRVLPDPKAAADAKIKMMELAQSGANAELDSATKLALAGADNVKAEATSQSWLTCNWRPLSALTFVALIVARMFGWTALNISDDEYLKLWELTKFCLGGYVVGRSVEQTVKSVAPMIAGVLKK